MVLETDKPARRWAVAFDSVTYFRGHRCDVHYIRDGGETSLNGNQFQNDLEQPGSLAHFIRED